MSRKLKILVCGDVEGNFKTLFSRVNAINEKNGPFDFLFCVGDFFSDSLKKLEPYKNGSLNVSVPTYILGPNKESHILYYEDLSGCEICPNVNYLGKHGILSSNGLKIAYISGIERTNAKSDITFSEKDTIAVRDAAIRKVGESQFSGVDILISSDWPKDVTNFDTSVDLKGVDKDGSQALAWLACQLKPRYHFAGIKNVFYERPPYRNCSKTEDGSLSNSHCTRFIGLAKVGNMEKNKWLYAANLTPLNDLKHQEILQSTIDETLCPYMNLTKEKKRNEIQFFYDMSPVEVELPKKRRKQSLPDSDKNKKNFDDPETCWFCLASSSVEKHLVVSIGEEVYVALAKGGLTPYHAMIIPIKHYRSQSDLPKSALEEVKKYKSALREFFKSKNQFPVVFERNYKTSHLQLHVVPVPNRCSSGLKELFLNFSEEKGLNLSELPNKSHLKDFTQSGAPYFYVELPTKEKLFCSCQKNFPLNFGRDVLASTSVLNIPDRVNWRDCIKPKDEEEKMTQNFRMEFESFDNVS